MVRRDDAEPASRIEGRDGGAGRDSWARAGLEGRGALCGSGRGLPVGLGAATGGGVLAADLAAGRACLAACFDGCLDARLVAGFPPFWAGARR